jgi:hypothetical protein
MGLALDPLFGDVFEGKVTWKSSSGIPTNPRAAWLTRVSMPPRKNCPHCGFFVEDWFREWYPYSEQREVYSGEIAADCPECHQGVKLTQEVEKAPPDAPILPRSRTAAQRWVRHEKRGQYPDLDAFLQSRDPAAPPYRNYPFRP